MKSSMASFAPNVRSLDCERLEHDQNDLDRNDERERSTMSFIWVNDERQKNRSKRSGTFRT